MLEILVVHLQEARLSIYEMYRFKAIHGSEAAKSSKQEHLGEIVEQMKACFAGCGYGPQAFCIQIYSKVGYRKLVPLLTVVFGSLE